MHVIHQLKAPRVEDDPLPKPEVSGLRSFRPAIRRSPIQSRSILIKKILWPPCLDRPLRCSAVDRRPMLHLLPDRRLPQIQCNSPSSKSGSPPPSSRSAPPTKRPVSNVEHFGEASSDSDGSVSMTIDVQEAENALLSPDEYDRLTPTRIPHDQYFTGYRDRVP